MKRIANQLQIDYDWYICVTRGGLQPCLDLAMLTGQFQIDTLCIRSYHKKVQEDLKYFIKDCNHLRDKSVLIIDDLVDTGKTMQTALNFIRESGKPKLIHSAVIYVKPCTTYIPNFYIEKDVPQDYILFPWDNERKIC